MNLFNSWKNFFEMEAIIIIISITYEEIEAQRF